MTTSSFDREWISASAVDVTTAAATTKPSASVDLMVVFMVFSPFRNSVSIRTGRYVQAVKMMPYKRRTLPIGTNALLIWHKNLRIPLAQISS
jgi:BarA-like signal transduction histidine kinase